MPVVVQAKHEHLRLCSFQDPVAKLLNFKTSLKGQLKFTSLNYDVGEVEKMDLKGVEHALASHDDLLWLLLDWETADKSSDFFGCLPLCKLTETLLACPNTRVDNLQEELS